MGRTRAALSSGALGTCLLALTACGGSQDASVVAVAADFYAAVGADDGETACALLSPTTRAEVEQSSGVSCAEGLRAEGLPSAADVEDVSVFGAMAQVRYAGETAYLTRDRDGWRVLAAGCTSRPTGPDDCQVEGG
ncbi:hypothetical protein [Nocardioides lijunqiniae]|uniref:hypothetical protein n=1 Tax=Nocardioides lijunqiniae TaxID=2760832 RepID=UPI001D0C47EA|nr:hypothetical protein [Nocardioides lijunqiniae]